MKKVIREYRLPMKKQRYTMKENWIRGTHK